MTIAKDFASKFSVAFVAIAMLFTLVAPAVNAQESSEDLQKTIADLLAQVAELESKMGGTTTTTTTTSCDVPMAPLTMGSQGAGVTALQNILISAGYSIPAGATGYFGAQTRSALAAWQAASNISPAAGYYGPISKAALEANCAPADDEDEDMDEDDDSSSDLSGEGELSSLEVDDASDTDVQENAEDAEIAELTLEAEDGDIEISRIDFKLDASTEDAYDVFDTISIWVDGDMVAEFDAADEDEYLNEDTGTFRISGLDLVVMEDEEIEITVGATVMASVDTLEQWTLTVEEVRYFDADGVATDEDDSDIITGDAKFDIVEEGDGEELKFSLGSNNPDATDIIVDEDDTTDGVTIMEYTIEAEEGDIELNTLAVRVDTSASTTAIVDDVYLVIDGEEFDAENLSSSNKGTFSKTESRYVDNNNTDDAVWYVFDIDGDVVIDMDEEVTAEVVVDFKAQDPNGNTAGVAYANGSTIQAQVSSVERGVTDAEGADNITEFSGSAIGEEHTLVATGIVLPVDGFSATVDTIGDNDTIGEYTLEFEVTAVEGDFYITDDVSTSTAITDGVRYTLDPTASGAATAVLESTGDEDTDGVFTVQEGETETFTLTVTFDPTTSGSFRVQLEEVWYSDETDGEDGEVYLPVPRQDFRTASKAINAN